MQFRSISLIVAFLLLGFATRAQAQPVITPNGVVNAASFLKGGVVPGSLAVASGSFAVSDPPPMNWSTLRYVFGSQEDQNAEEASQAGRDRGEAAPG